eukprot:COSAG03_NODE_6031_length_1128_cov_1.082604_1_plen_36_part_10
MWRGADGRRVPHRLINVDLDLNLSHAEKVKQTGSTP